MFSLRFQFYDCRGVLHSREKLYADDFLGCPQRPLMMPVILEKRQGEKHASWEQDEGGSVLPGNQGGAHNSLSSKGLNNPALPLC